MNRKNGLLQLKEFNELYTIKVTNTQTTMLQDNLMQLGQANQGDKRTYQVIENDSQTVVLEVDTQNDEKFIATLMKEFKIKELELYYMCD